MGERGSRMGGGEIDLAVRGAHIVTDQGMVDGDLYVRDGQIVGIGRPDTLDLSAEETVDASGLFVLPGMIDAHVHFMDPGDPEREDFQTGSAAAAASGVTTVLEHTHGMPVHSAQDLRDKEEHLRGRSVVDFGLGAHFSPRSVDEIEDVWRAGAAFIKVFTCTTHGIQAVESGPLFRAMQRLAGLDAMFLVHAEDESLTESAEAELKGAGRVDGGVVPEWRNLLAEQVAVNMVAILANKSGAKAIVAHCSHPSIADVAANYRSDGARIWAETCPQYLFLYEKEAEEYGPFRKFTPPARAASPEDLHAMWERLRDGRISYVASDHAPSTRAQKEEGSIWECHFGLPGIDTTMALMLDAVFSERLSMSRLAEMYAKTPAVLYGLYPRKGVLRVGSDADFVLVDPTERRVIEDANVLSKAGWTPYAGREVKGNVVATYLRGQKIAEQGRVVAQRAGRFVPGPGKTAT